jgi:hypothetical protein
VVGERGRDRAGGGEDGVEEIGADDRVAGSGGEGGFEEAGLGLAEEVFLRAEADAVEIGGIEIGGVAGEDGGAAGADGVLGHFVADLEGVFAGDADRHGDLVARVERVDEIGDATAPAGGRGFIGDAVLPLDLLVAVREELRRKRDAAGGVLGLGGRVNERADVGEERGLAGAEHAVEIGDGWVESPGAAIAGRLGGETEEGGLGDREIGTGGGVGGVAGAHRNDEVVGIVAAVEEEADEGFVVGGDGGAGGGGGLRAVGGTGGGAHEAEAAESGEEAGGTDGGAAGGTEEFAAGNFGGGFFAHGGNGRGGDGERERGGSEPRRRVVGEKD